MRVYDPAINITQRVLQLGDLIRKFYFIFKICCCDDGGPTVLDQEWIQVREGRQEKIFCLRSRMLRLSGNVENSLWSSVSERRLSDRSRVFKLLRLEMSCPS